MRGEEKEGLVREMGCTVGEKKKGVYKRGRGEGVYGVYTRHTRHTRYT